MSQANQLKHERNQAMTSVLRKLYGVPKVFDESLNDFVHILKRIK